MNHRYVGTMLVITALVCSSASGQANTRRGATLGGVAGAIAGGIIGENNDEAGAGAVIGGVLGAVAGGALGSAKDQEQAMQRQQYQYQQQNYQYQQQRYAEVQAAVTPADVINMTRSGLPDTVIMSHIQQRGVQRRLEVSDIISLHQQGVREPVISALQHATVGGPATQPAPQPVVVQERPVIVEQRYYTPPPAVIVPAPRYYHRPHYHGRPHHHRGGTRVGISFGL
ncbi:glycine zipper domain-containing protein [Roseimaritima ulvae]|uniref:Glycine zipper domain-containing protein n=1 Tax=Roseimaritima ulvae TaxID=980254 RepID=A0A5B9QVP5_9BACT|nr:glycine zipper domain-containing protein [Roseimaritima ulvae]QEG41166.1 hypothetical protein UC8_31850 [Roseimaritima ulvae]